MARVEVLSPLVGFSLAIMTALFTSCMDFERFVTFTTMDNLAPLTAEPFDLKVLAAAMGAAGQFLLPGHGDNLLQLND